VRLLIDGYNLLHATPWLNADGTDRDPPDIRRAAMRLIDQLSETCLPLFSRCTIVFDAKADAPLWERRRETIRGIEVVRALDWPDADDLIIEMIRDDTGPRDLVVVTSDSFIRSVAEQRGAEVKASEEFWNWIDELRASKALTSDEVKELEKPAIVTAEERERALHEFTEYRARVPEPDPKARRPRRTRLRIRNRRRRRLR